MDSKVWIAVIVGAVIGYFIGAKFPSMANKVGVSS